MAINFNELSTTAPVPTKEEVDKKADKPETSTPGNLAKFDENGNTVDSGYHLEVRNGIPCIVQYT